MSYTTLYANDPESDRYVITKNGVNVGSVAEVRHSATNPEENGLIYVGNPELDTTPFTLKKRAADDYAHTDVTLIFTNEV